MGDSSWDTSRQNILIGIICIIKLCNHPSRDMHGLQNTSASFLIVLKAKCSMCEIDRSTRRDETSVVGEWSIHTCDLLDVNYWVIYSRKNGLYCTKLPHSHLFFGHLLRRLKSSIMDCVDCVIAWTEKFTQECIPVGCVPAAHWPYARGCLLVGRGASFRGCASFLGGCLLPRGSPSWGVSFRGAPPSGGGGGASFPGAGLGGIPACTEADPRC